MNHPVLIRSIVLFIFVMCTSLGMRAQSQAEHSFRVKGFYIDCRTEVMKMPAIKQQVLELSQKGINTLLFEYEATFPFKQHATLCNEFAYTEAEVKDLVSYSAGLGVEVIPLQNCFGHCEYILRHDRYAHLREDKKEVSQVCPLKINEASQVFGEIFREVAALHPSKYFHIGADETYLLGDCKNCAVVAAKEGKSRLFVDYVKAMCKIVTEMGKTPIIWADIILMHPDAVHELPKELVLIDWNYGWEPDRFGKLENLYATGAEVWGASSMRSHPDNIYLTQWEKHFNNLTTFVPFAREKNYKGMIQTSWSTSGTYGFHYDTNSEIINMQPVRSVYPTLGFNVLIDATCTAFNSTQPLNGKEFAMDYARKQYGLTAAECEIFWEYLTHPQFVILQSFKDEKGTPVATVLDDCMKLKDKFSKLSPGKNKEEFEHYKLMLDLRINYLTYKKIEAFYESPEYTRSHASQLINQLKPVISESDELSKRFIKLNKDYLKPGQPEYINHIRTEKMKSLYQWLVNQQN
ncbi:family 20 glycosylhydrolase [Bacteroides sp. 51]|uniref:family 20 glycosylhydrolase n=1 Tax=Bacteroides sp. 51 TaxID=2302938 RepID=UPI0013D1BB1B|nr:family 20 glycosylhydrolase [Bacteroides sp. 51]NDV82483.1 glycoside hydrolase [Bacteroides sp. 51]